LTLVGLVCGDCNRSFDKQKLDSTLTKKSPEGFARYLAGQKPLDRLNEFEDRNELSWHRIPEGPLAGAKTLYRPEEGKNDHLAPAQIIFSDVTPPVSMSWKEVLAAGGYNLKNREIILLPGADASLETMHDFLKSKGIGIGKIQEIDITDLDIKTREELQPTELYSRALVKNAFNYMAYVTSKHLPDHIFEKCFDPMRRYALTGEINQRKTPVMFFAHPHFKELEVKTGRWHRATLYSESSDGITSLVCDIQFFSGITWKVFLADNYPHADLMLDFEHVWNCDAKSNHMSQGNHHE